MTVQELMERLEDMDPEAEVRLMTQENWPMEHRVMGITDADEVARNAEHGDDFTPADGHGPTVVYIVEGEQLGYGNKAAWAVAQ